MRIVLISLSLLSLLFAGAIFGFFYAWVCSTMWGLDQADPNVAIQAMQAMNASVRNGVFAPAFFGTPFVLLLTGVVAWRAGARRAALFILSGAAIYFGGGMLLTMSVNVPMNEALALIETPLPEAEASTIWSEYSSVWQVWNQIRTVFSGLTLLLVGMAIFSLPHKPRL
ncbi:anthrone oxygenase family protein [Falsiruegeria mediterranea]|jgi:uncharacterized membrane protein|uniref:DUF1772 domain-containing protein n=1 Tax=Falsiruegeria mediterranea M17 TaxID=1200281 RepID=A0A2R8C6T6_9RHOB|nr:anthrone oxygenase family protein [Falsiruegeria mediterranea]SPJ28118.1 hypothetical protein TRM7615_01615 [Falsiruegeria mediterranea M17]